MRNRTRSMLALVPATLLASLATPQLLLAQEPAPPHPSVELPAELDRVLRDYEREWSAGNAAALAALFTEDGFALPTGRAPVRGREAIEAHYRNAGGPLQLRALAFEVADPIGYIIGAYGYEGRAGDMGKFVLALRRGSDGTWLIAADIDNSSSRPPDP